MNTEALRPRRLRLLRSALCLAGLAALSLASNAAEPADRTGNRCEPITKACNNPLIIPRQTATPEKTAAAPSKRNRCEPITKVCIYKSEARAESSTAPEPQRMETSAKSKRQRCEPITKVCIYK